MIEMLNLSSAWSKIKAGFKGADMFMSPAAKGSYRYVDGIKSDVAVSQQRPGSIASAFTGKTFSAKK